METKARSALIFIIPVIGMFIKVLTFDLVWCYYTTFSAMSRLSTYTTALLLTLVLSLPYILSRRQWVALTVMALTDIWFICNLMYFLTYATAIPPSSYSLAGNLVDFLPSVADSVRLNDLLIPLSTIISGLLMHRFKGEKQPSVNRLHYVGVIVIGALAVYLPLRPKGGFIKEYTALRSSAYLHSSCTPMFTLAGTLIYDLSQSSPTPSADDLETVARYRLSQPAPAALGDSSSIDNVVLIMAESLESWVINTTVEGVEITPCLNKLIADTTTLYAPHVLSQVGGGRSIDAQLLILAGLHPVQTGTYSTLYPDHTYLTLPKALKEIKGTRNYLLTVDKTKVWNQGAVARAFGIDTIISHPDWQHTEMFGTRGHLSDRAFLEQLQQKIENNQIWPVGQKAFLQIVTYSGHAPFKLPQQLKTVSFSPRVPQVMNDYMTTARFTDSAIGKFIDYLKSRPDYDRTIVIITGDHEGLANYRDELTKSDAGRGIVSTDQFTPLIILNSPVKGLKPATMGQIDIYPTIMHLAGLTRYTWQGIGNSIADPRHPGAAVYRQGTQVIPATTPDSIRSRLIQALTVSDNIIRFNLLAPHFPQ